MRVFVVEDEKISLARLMGLLSEFDHVEVVGTATNVGDAIKGILNSDPELVFLDIELGNQSGIDVINEVRKHGNNSDFIFVTAHLQYAIQAVRAQAIDYLLKPIDLGELGESIERFSQHQEMRNIGLVIENLTILTVKEKAVLKEVVTGKTSKQIAEILKLSPLTVDTHRKNILAKFKASNTIDLIAKISTIKVHS